MERWTNLDILAKFRSSDKYKLMQKLIIVMNAFQGNTCNFWLNNIAPVLKKQFELHAYEQSKCKKN